VQRLALDPQTGAVWVNEHGPLGGDELNRVQKGEFHGWPRATYAAHYRTGERFTPDRTLEDAVAPSAVWTSAVAPSGLAFYTGDRFPDWYGNLF
jgi:glucose/arabinose dehydrogenase